MKVVYIPAKVQCGDLEPLVKKVKIQEPFAIVTTVQFLHDVEKLRAKGYRIAGQILGCNTLKTQPHADHVSAYLYIGTGKFHPLNLAYHGKKRVYTLDPLTEEFSQVTQEDVQRYERRLKGMLARYYAADKIGIIVSKKSGQNNLPRALTFKKTCGKEAYIFLCDNVQHLEDFSDIDCWVNTACVRIFEDDLNVPIVNIRDVERGKLN